jgi:hypothetical protein
MIKTNTSKMNRRMFCATLSALVLTTMSLAVPAASAKDGNDNDTNSASRSRSALTGAPLSGQTPNGHADFRSDSGKNRTRLNVEVEDVNLPAGTKLDVVLDHAGTRTKVGQITLDAFHSGELELNSEDGDLVPAVKKGDIVIVMNATSAILTGVL